MKVSHQVRISATLVCMLALAYIIYMPGFEGVFLVDDGVHLVALNVDGGVKGFDGAVRFAFGADASSIGRPISMASFLIDDQYYPGDVARYRNTNTLIHLLVAVAIFQFMRLLLRRLSFGGAPSTADWCAVLVVSWWLYAPIHVSTVLYVIQRMTQLATLFVLIGLSLYIYGGELQRRGIEVIGRATSFFGLYFFGLLAVLSKENGVVIFPLAAIIEYVIYISCRGRINRFNLFITLAPVALGLMFLIIKWSDITGSKYRDFTVEERLLTEGRIVWDYVHGLLLPKIKMMGLVHDDISISRSLVFPFSTLVAIVAHILLLVVCFVVRRRFPLLFLGVCGFYVAHSVESTIIPLELYFEHRNYLPSIFLFLGVVGVIFSVSKKHLKFGFLLILILLILNIILTHTRARLWGEPLRMFITWADEHPNSLRGQTILLKTAIQVKRFDIASSVLRGAQDVWPEYVHFDLIRLNQSCDGDLSMDVNTLRKIDHIDKDSVYEGSVLPVVENTFRIFKKGECTLIDQRRMLGILDGLKNIKYARGRFKAKLAFMEFEVFAKNGLLDKSMGALEEAYIYSKDSTLLYIKAGALFGAGIYDEALLEIDRAINAEHNKSIFKRKDMSNYFLLRKNIQSEM